MTANVRREWVQRASSALGMDTSTLRLDIDGCPFEPWGWTIWSVSFKLDLCVPISTSWGVHHQV